MSASLVGSEMCIRDRSSGGPSASPGGGSASGWRPVSATPRRKAREHPGLGWAARGPWRAPQCTDHASCPGRLP
eukprot:15032899-Alexandrium_andersonii.AAC.1